MQQLAVKVKPNSKQVTLAWNGEKLAVRLTASPQDGKANRQLVEVLAKEFGLAKRQVVIAKGHTSSNKLLQLDVSQAQLDQHLAGLDQLPEQTKLLPL
ncbi:DUF167 domain-containing protein [Candidatus Saccharibacteria bacterium]|nr:DUF167 domain-containing protein [Candidatus Saccharibacteria bacterium]MCB9821682.1 DUF167 domain-containing protein [Candidatus Nomurabacteria bacterium]